MCGTRLLWIALLFHLAKADQGITIPANYDAVELWGHCVGFIPENQGTCNACAAAALASTLGIRSCIHNGINLRFSSQQIWDCYEGSCEAGVKIRDFLFDIVYGTMSEFMLTPLSDNTNSLHIQNSNISKCKSGYKGQDRIATISEHKEEWLLNSLSDPQNFTKDTPHSIRSMQIEIMENGPIVAILYLTVDEMNAFRAWRQRNSNDIFYGSEQGPKASRTLLHAVSVIGWGRDSQRNTFYWKILNSFGSSWGFNGTGNIAGSSVLIGSQWYSASSTSPLIQCNPGVNGCPKPSTNTKDEMIVTVKANTIVNSQTFLPLLPHTDVKSTHNGSTDAIVLLITISCMSILSLLICQTQTCFKKKYQQDRKWIKNEQHTWYSALPPPPIHVF